LLDMGLTLSILNGVVTLDSLATVASLPKKSKSLDLPAPVWEFYCPTEIY
jgi:hypothetical protein